MIKTHISILNTIPTNAPTQYDTPTVTPISHYTPVVAQTLIPTSTVAIQKWSFHFTITGIQLVGTIIFYTIRLNSLP